MLTLSDEQFARLKDAMFMQIKSQANLEARIKKLCAELNCDEGRLYEYWDANKM
tara:strand:+ start:291 stop:452 length:162 start_codon:yes stop_codon:yes gene_type:complete